MKVGIVGLPNAGKSTLFNALTAAGAETGQHPFTTIDPNVAVVPVSDPRVEEIAEVMQSTSIVNETIEFADIAGLVPGAAEGEGLGNQFLHAIRETDAICHVVRAHSSDDVPHPEGRVDPAADAELVETELLAADLESAEGRLARVTKQAKSGDKEAIAERDWLERVSEALSAGEPVRKVPPPDEAPDALRQLAPLTAKPVLYVVNVDEEASDVPAALVEHAEQAGAGIVEISARVEAELSELDPSEREEMRAELGVEGTGLERLIAAAYELLGLITFYTADRDTEATARSLRRGLTAFDAAGKVHREIQEGFVRAEVVGCKEFVDAGGWPSVRDAGVLRIEGRDYVVADGDVINIRH